MHRNLSVVIPHILYRELPYLSTLNEEQRLTADLLYVTIGRYIRFNAPDHEPVIEYLAQHGIGVSQMGSGLRPGTFWVNFDTEDAVGFTIEIMKSLPGTSGKTPKINDGEVQA